MHCAGRLSGPASPRRADAKHSQSDCRRAIGPFSPFRLGRPYKRPLEPDGSPLFTRNLWTACRRYEPRKHLKTLAIARREILPSPARDKVGLASHRRPGTTALATCPRCRAPPLRNRWFARLPAGGRWIRTCMGLLLSRVVLVIVTSLVRSGKGPSSSRRLAIRFAERAEGVKGPKRSKAWRLAA
jgi:hypothetical protein